MKKYDVIIIGAGSVGVPTALSISQKGKTVLCIDSLSSAGQGNNKKAIGGVRATHSDFAKIKICLRSLEIFSQWEKKYGVNIGWKKHGYSFPAYDIETEKMLKELLEIQKSFGLKINWISAEEYIKLVPGINPAGLRGATFSSEDGSISNLLAINEFWAESKKCGAEYKFNEKVIDIKEENGFEVITDKGNYQCEFVINAAGNYAAQIAKMIEVDLPITPDNHEAAISEPVQDFMGPMVVDLRSDEGSKNFYFYQNSEGQVVFCLTPAPPIIKIDDNATSVFFPQIGKRMISLLPKLKNLKVRRAWRGQYPMTPDGFPIVGFVDKHSKFFNLTGMCGQGVMLGPGLSELTARFIFGEETEEDKKIINSFSLNRDFSGMEKFK